MAKEIRRKRKTNLYMKLRRIIENTDYSREAALIIVEAIDENITTTQMNQLNISLKNKMQEYIGEQE